MAILVATALSATAIIFSETIWLNSVMLTPPPVIAVIHICDRRIPITMGAWIHNVARSSESFRLGYFISIPSPRRHRLVPRAHHAGRRCQPRGPQKPERSLRLRPACSRGRS